jgi:C-terminal processing protease CtpA/Prc
MRLASVPILAFAAAAPFSAQTAAERDLRFAIAEVGKQCSALLATKRIDLARVEKELAPAAKAAKSDADHYLVLVRLLARLRDGHAQVRVPDGAQRPRLPGDGPRAGPGITLCRAGDKVYVRSATKAAHGAGAVPGAEVVAIDGKPALRWLTERCAELRDTISFSTDHHAFAVTCAGGLWQEPGARLELVLVPPGNGAARRTCTLRCNEKHGFGPAVLPDGLATTADLAYGRLPSGHGYVHVRRCKETLPEQMDQALAALAACKGLVLDFRGNGGGGFDHEAVLGRFLRKGETLGGGKGYASAGPNPYGGPVVVIVDALVVSAGETGSGMFKEDGRGWMIGESATAGMSSQKTTIELPSRRFSLYVSTHSNKQRFQDGKGIEGIGVVPHEVVPFDPKVAATGVDPWIHRAEAVLADFPHANVPYRSR